MSVEETKKRRACNACTKAKAKCTPLEAGAEICERCSRLGKECVYGDSLRKRGPRTRSRMKQLEQRVESLMGMLATNGQDIDMQGTDTDQQDNTQHDQAVPQPYITPEASPPQAPNTAPKHYDPVEAGLLNESEASELLSEFRQHHSQVFPFVLLDVNVDAVALRRQQPFLFLAIMGAMAHRRPYTQRLLADAFQDQIAHRIVRCSHKGLEILQGLLIHAGYYHYFYRPGKQQLALLVQLCVATAQDFGLSKKWRHDHKTCSTFETSLAGQRAMLGTYYLSAAFAHAWRRRNSMHYTRGLARSCQTFAQNPECPSDVLIAPLIHSSEMMCRINDYFSYDELHYSDIRGETMTELSTNNFTAELNRLRDATPKAAQSNLTVRIAFDMLDVLVHECSFHNIFWSMPSTATVTVTPMRARMIQRSIKASQILFNELVEEPSSGLHHLAFPAWSNWFYSTLLVVKIIVFQRTGRNESSCVHNTPHAVGEILPQEYGETASAAVCNITESFSQASLRDKPVTPEETLLISMFEDFLKKVEAAVPSGQETSGTKPFLKKVATLQKGLLSSLRKITEYREGGRTNLTPAEQALVDSLEPGPAVDFCSPSFDNYNTRQQSAARTSSDELMDLPEFDESIMANFDPMAQAQDPSDAWLFNMVMNDTSNMFSW